MDRIRVFISSTQTDLQAERDSVESVVAELGYECLVAMAEGSLHRSDVVASLEKLSGKGEPLGVTRGSLGVAAGQVGPMLLLDDAQVLLQRPEERDRQHGNAVLGSLSLADETRRPIQTRVAWPWRGESPSAESVAMARVGTMVGISLSGSGVGLRSLAIDA